MNYPIDILPNENYKYIDCDISRFKLIRFFKKTEGESIIDFETNNIRAKYIAEPSVNIADCSTNLFGVFKIDDLYIALTEEGKRIYSEYCEPELNIEVPLYETHFTFDRDREYFVIYIEDLVNLSQISYQIGNDTFWAKCVLKHTPMKWNFWHFSIRWLLADGDWLHNHKGKKWAKRLSATARANITHNAKIEKVVTTPIAHSCYKK